MKWIKTKMMSIYLFKLTLRVIIFLSLFGLYLYDKQKMMGLLYQTLFLNINSLHILWFGFMLMMLKHLFPKEPFTMALLKSKEKKFEPVDDYSRSELLEFVQNQNYRAWQVMLI